MTADQIWKAVAVICTLGVIALALASCAPSDPIADVALKGLDVTLYPQDRPPVLYVAPAWWLP